MKNIFQNINANRPQYSTFDLGHEVKQSMKMGKLTPFFCQEVLPGDSFRMNSEVFARLQPMLSPAMHRINLYTHFFFVPNRIIWDEFQDFITGGDDGTAAPIPPYIDFSGVSAADFYCKGSLANYLGFPAMTEDFQYKHRISALPFRAYQEIYNEYYRDQNLIDKVEFSKASGDSQTGSYSTDDILTLRSRCWEKDYFTSALPFTQKGDAVLLPLAGTGTVDFTGNTTPTSASTSTINIAGGISSTMMFDEPNQLGVKSISGTPADEATASISLNIPSQAVSGSGTVDISGLNNTTQINDLREAFQVQRYLEQLARGGSRYTEWLKSFFGVTSSDARLQRPEYLGGGMSPIVMSEVLQTSSTDGTSPQGNLAGHGICANSYHSFTKRFEEHGIVIGIMSILPRTAYSQGIPKMFQRFDKFDYYTPTFAHLGEQPIRKDELFPNPAVSQDHEDNAGTFGYQSRYAEYRYLPSRVAGDMAENLDFWHLGRKFATQPTLSGEFVTYDNSADNNRIFAVTDPNEDQYMVQIWNGLIATRPIPFDAQPGMVDHF